MTYNSIQTQQTTLTEHVKKTAYQAWYQQPNRQELSAESRNISSKLVSLFYIASSCRELTREVATADTNASI